MANETNRKTLRALLDILCDAHLVLTENGATINGTLLKLDERVAQKSPGTYSYARLADRQIGLLIHLLQEQADRCNRIAQELKTVKNSMQTT